MDTGKIIEGIETRMFDPSYFSALKTSYRNEVAAGYFETEEKEYALGAEFLSQKLSVEQQAILANMESNYAEKYSIASTYPFYCGLICAFEQFFLPDQQQSFDFNTTIDEDLNTLPRMKRHVRYCTSGQLHVICGIHDPTALWFEWLIYRIEVRATIWPQSPDPFDLLRATYLPEPHSYCTG